MVASDGAACCLAVLWHSPGPGREDDRQCPVRRQATKPTSSPRGLRVDRRGLWIVVAQGAEVASRREQPDGTSFPGDAGGVPMGFARRVVRISVRKATPKSVRRVTHPVRTTKNALTPRPVRRASRTVYQASHPIKAAENYVIRTALGGTAGRPTSKGAGSRKSRANPASGVTRTPNVTPSRAVAHSAPTIRATSVAGPGWHADPWRRYEWRYWDGANWTGFVAVAGRSFVDSCVAGETPRPTAIEPPVVPDASRADVTLPVREAVTTPEGVLPDSSPPNETTPAPNQADVLRLLSAAPATAALAEFLEPEDWTVERVGVSVLGLPATSFRIDICFPSQPESRVAMARLTLGRPEPQVVLGWEISGMHQIARGPVAFEHFPPSGSAAIDCVRLPAAWFS